MGLTVVWTLNRHGNHGDQAATLGLAGVLVRGLQCKNISKSNIQEQELPDLQALEDWCAVNDLIQHPTTLLEAFGVKLKCYAKPYDMAKAMQGIHNNILATYFTCAKEDGLAPNTIIGRAVFVRYDPVTNQPVNFTRTEFLRLGFAINDMMELCDRETSWTRNSRTGSKALKSTLLTNIRKVLPYYDANLGDTLSADGFSGNKGRYCFVCPDGSLDMSAGMTIRPSALIPGTDAPFSPSPATGSSLDGVD